MPSSSSHISYRSKFEIVNDILRKVLESPVINRRHKTTIEHATRLAHWLTVKYPKALIELDLFRISNEAGPYRHYEITPKGIRYLQVFGEIEDDFPEVITSNF